MADGPVYLSFDIDSHDPSIAPGTGTPEIAGLNTIQGWRSAVAGDSTSLAATWSSCPHPTIPQETRRLPRQTCCLRCYAFYQECKGETCIHLVRCEIVSTTPWPI